MALAVWIALQVDTGVVTVVTFVWMQTAAGEVESPLRQDVSTHDQVAVVLLARHHTRLPQHLRPGVRALPAAEVARPLSRHVHVAYSCSRCQHQVFLSLWRDWRPSTSQYSDWKTGAADFQFFSGCKSLLSQPIPPLCFSSALFMSVPASLPWAVPSNPPRGLCSAVSLSGRVRAGVRPNTHFCVFSAEKGLWRQQLDER